jgi:hypothetical protein
MRAFYLIVIVDAAEEKEYGVTNYSFFRSWYEIENIVVDSEGQVLEGKKVENTRKKYSRFRRGFQKVGNKLANVNYDNYWLEKDVVSRY